MMSRLAAARDRGGAEIVMPPELQFWGDRYGIAIDPFGVSRPMGRPSG